MGVAGTAWTERGRVALIGVSISHVGLLPLQRAISFFNGAALRLLGFREKRMFFFKMWKIKPQHSHDLKLRLQINAIVPAPITDLEATFCQEGKGEGSLLGVGVGEGENRKNTGGKIPGASAAASRASWPLGH